MTVDRAIALIDGGATANQLYVALTRGRHENRAIVVTDQPDEAHTAAGRTDTLEVLHGVLRRTDPATAAHDLLRQDRQLKADEKVEQAVLKRSQRIERHGGPASTRAVDRLLEGRAR